MADDKQGRDKQARDEERRQRERELEATLERGDEPEPPIEAEELTDLEAELESVSFPAPATEVVATIGDREIEVPDGRVAVAELVANADAETFDSPAAVRKRVQRPTVAAAMKRVAEAADTLRNVELGGSQRDAYEKTFEELKAIDADDDEGIRAIADWIVDRVREKEALPGSRAVRRQAAEFCRANGYEVRNDEWLGV
ncbi:DUF5789 family protein [Halorussus marinus]|uniref:DUF5789 family protein n=1 Tax=Halorussus marinus TaxID=2505976 RepID=UPI00106DEF14|nr:hypothetical protein [Halorussus marinus]